MEKVEKIASAALRFTFSPDEKRYFQYFTNNSHGNIVNLMAALDLPLKIRYNQTYGFMTTNNRFVDRIEALAIAVNANQVIKKYPPYDELCSEDMLNEDGEYSYG